MFVETGGREKEVGDAPTEWIEQQIGELAAHIAAATCRWLELIAEFDQRRGHEQWGFHSCGAWVSWRCSLDPRSAREHVRVARALGTLPFVRERFRRGELSYSKVRAITRIATPEIEDELVEMARFATAAQLERLVRGYRRAVSLESAEAAHRDRFLACEWDDDGSLRIRGRLAPADGALFLKAIEAGRDAIVKRDPSSPVNRADALMEVAEWALAGNEDVRKAGDRHQVVIHADERALAGTSDDGAAGCRIEDGPAICAETARRLACDASLVSIRHGESGALDIGRKSRAIPPAMRRALEVRDEGRCQFPGCENDRWVDAHHIVHWAKGGHTKLDNLVLLCSHHHRLLHEGGFSLSRLRDGTLVFRRPTGEQVPRVAPVPRGSWKGVRQQKGTGGVRIGPDTVTPLGRGERCDYELAVWGLLARAGPG